MKNYYTISRIIISILTVIISFIALNNEDSSLKVAATVLIAIASLIMSFWATPVSKRIISVGDSITNKYLRVLYYLVILPLVLAAVYVLCMLVLFVYNHSEHSTEFGNALGEALITVFLYTVIFIMFIVPYLQTLIVLLFRALLKDNKH